MEIIKVYSERLPGSKLIGKKYADADRDEHGSFGHKWNEWWKYADGILKENAPPLDDSYVGAMRHNEAGDFEYWIGILLPEDAVAPDGFDWIQIPPSRMLVCYVYGSEKNGEIFGMDVHDSCLKKWREQGYNVPDTAWFIERYNCPRYTAPDEKGNVILDYCALFK